MIHNADRILGALSLAPMTVNELSKRLCMNRNTCASTVNRMLIRGLIWCWAVVRGNGRPEYRYGLVWKD